MYFSVHSELYACGNVSLQLTDPAGTITSPGFDTNVYDNDLECLWIITPQMGHVVQLTFHTLDIEDSYQCGKDSLSVSQMQSAEGPTKTKIEAGPARAHWYH